MVIGSNPANGTGKEARNEIEARIGFYELALVIDVNSLIEYLDPLARIERRPALIFSDSLFRFIKLIQNFSEQDFIQAAAS